MSYTAALDHLYAKGLELAPSSSNAPRRKFDLEHMRLLSRALGDPQASFPAVLIAGTNGKGSTAATLSSILTAAGYRTGLYTSPHLSRVNERIRIDGTPISDDDFARLYFAVDTVAEKLVADGTLPHHPSFFESLTAIAFAYYAEQKIEIAVLEVGLGGRLDATNIVDPLISILTDISLDHQDYLGNTITEITREKAGILRPHGTLITLPQHPEANQAIGEAAATLELHAISAANFTPTAEKLLSQATGVQYHPSADGQAIALPRNRYTLTLNHQPLHVDSPLIGQHQQRNIALAIAAAEELRNPQGYTMLKSNPKSYKISTTAIEQGIRNTRWPGRLELLTPATAEAPVEAPATIAPLLLDVAHNPAGAWTLRSVIAHLPESQPRTLIFSCLRDKDLREMAQILLPLFDSSADRPHDHILFTPINSPRAASLADLAAVAAELEIPATTASSLAEALAEARRITPSNGIILATGSVYLIGELRTLALQEGYSTA
ncbi:MAG: bifunctional folylpolyglutamate synthase/dihydrofolate synthase [Edaphobacter sp.]|uniref:bifunctional folylpolyglutamate synthase/dihydrofolate synthase n=1 Tax=Edaphobacter sp. TaxID=1934404 RepID=UPI002396C40F|nr:folylpolyglutamate synthase/dihydrofolate synthase family protein [Edaphobacter sp.]MDE1176678.1 bifunctional folylpolyglutamate synthase/dihydrofolate synthase [Edaphobacter sp.]